MQADEELALLYLDLDHFKPVNDMFGHAAGNEILKLVANRITEQTRGNDVIARLGGDEFAILQVGGSQPIGSRRLAQRLIDALTEPFDVNGTPVFIGATIGIAISPYDGSQEDELMINADLAMYCAKSAGRNSFRYFEPEMNSRMRVRRALEADLRNAIVNDEFEVHYQPLMDFASKKIVCFEALVRWRHRTVGLIPPNDFIPLAEETGLIVALGELVLRKACLEASKWDESIGVAVNLSAIQLRERTLFTTILSALDDAKLSANRLELEITETALIANTDLTIGLLHQLRSLGVRIALDDFGTGHSSINYLRQFRFDKIKIDKSFVSGPEASDKSNAMVQMIASLGNSLGAATTAEGVETAVQMNSVKFAGCSQIQGYLLSKPVPADAVQELLKNYPVTHSHLIIESE